MNEKNSPGLDEDLGSEAIWALAPRIYETGSADERVTPELSFAEHDVTTLTAGPGALCRAMTNPRPKVSDVLKVAGIGPSGGRQTVDMRRHL